MASLFQGLRTVGYHVPDLAAAKEWYSKILGVAPYFDEPFYVGFNVGGYELGLQPGGAANEAGLCNVVTYWGVDDVQTMYDTLIGDGASVLEAPAEVGGGIVVAAVRDPWGNAFGIIYNPHFKIG